MPAFLAPIVASVVAIALIQAAPQEYDASMLPRVTGPRSPSYGDLTTNVLNASDPRRAKRANTIPAVALPDGDAVVKDKMDADAGWKAYQVTVQAGQTVKFRLRSSNEDWFMLKVANRLGNVEKGMVPHSVRTIEPQTTYTNSSKETKTVYLIVDTTNLDADKVEYSLHVTFGD